MFSKRPDYAREVARLSEVQAALDADPDAFMRATKKLTDRDYRMIGMFIQMYCNAQFNARRAIDAIHEAALGPAERKASTWQDKQVFPKLKEAAQMLWDMNMRDTLVRASDILVMHHDRRHNLAHWTALRVGKGDALIILSKNATEAQRHTGLTLDTHDSCHGLLSVPLFKEEMRKMHQHVHNLSAIAPLLEKGVDELRSEFDRRGMHPLKPRKPADSDEAKSKKAKGLPKRKPPPPKNT